MQLVIEIDENEYIGIKSFPNGNTSYPWTLHLYDAVRNGTPLPKGHGRLVDADRAYEFNSIDDMPTIIEADKE